MGGDLGPRLAVLAAQNFAQAHPDTRLLLIGDVAQIDEWRTAEFANIQVESTSSIVTMQDRPAFALRNKQSSSMAKAVDCVVSGRADACVSAGNTGALMAFGLMKLGTVDEIDRPAICRAVPSATGKSFLLDLGANIDCSADQLVQFALLGRAMAKASGVQEPSIGVLNVGVEEHKGGALQRETLSKLRQAKLNVVGFIEGDGIFKGLADVIVCDGFVGNAVLKASEGAADLMRRSFAEAVAELDIANTTRFKSALAQYDPEQFNGAALLGLDGVVIKAHGATTEVGFIAALNVALELVNREFLSFLRNEMREL